MTYDVSVNGFWLSGMGASLFERRLPVLPETNDNKVKIAINDGVTDFGASYDERIIGLTFEITSSAADYHTTLAQLARMFNVKRGEVALEFTDMRGKIYKAVYAGSFTLGAVGSRLVDIELHMNDPWPTGSEVVTEYTLSTSPQSAVIESKADVKAQPVIVMTNTGSSIIHGFTLTNEYELE